MKHVKTFAFLIITILAIFGATKLTLQSPLVERTNTPLDNLVLSKNIDAAENDRFFANLANNN